MTTNPTWALLVALLSSLLISNANAEIYKWTDKDGKVHFSATPPKDTSAKAKNIEEEIKFKIGKVQKTSSAPKPAVIAKAQTTAKKDSSDKKTKVAAKDPYAGDKSPGRLAYCNKLRSNISVLGKSKGKNLVRKGQTRPLSERERVSRLKADQKSLDKNCKGL